MCMLCIHVCVCVCVWCIRVCLFGRLSISLCVFAWSSLSKVRFSGKLKHLDHVSIENSGWDILYSFCPVKECVYSL